MSNTQFRALWFYLMGLSFLVVCLYFFSQDAGNLAMVFLVLSAMMKAIAWGNFFSWNATTQYMEYKEKRGRK